MLLKLELKDCFVHKDFVLDFKKGLTTITGMNGKGKTLIVEMSEFCLWGTAALRGNSDGYKGVKANLEFLIRGKTYRVERTITSAKLYEAGVMVANGTKPVNSKIQELFGYSYEVFKVTNIARQGEIERMGNMRPTERKALVDETIGLAKIDALSDWAAKEYLGVRSKIDALEGVMVAPGALPEPPPAVAAATVTALQQQQATYKAHLPYLAPVAPHARAAELVALKAQQAQRVQAMSDIRGLEKAIAGYPVLGVAPTPHPMAAQRQTLVDESAAFRTAQTQKASVEQILVGFPEDSVYTDEQLQVFRNELKALNRFIEKETLKNKLSHYKCPKCEHEWTSDNPELEKYKDVPDVRPKFTLQLFDIEKHEKINAYQASRKQMLETLEKIKQILKTNSDHSKTVAEIDAAEKAVSQWQIRLEQEAERVKLVAQVKSIVVPEDVSAVVSEIEVQQAALVRHYEATAAVRGIPENISELVSAAEAGRAAWTLYEFEEAQHRVATQIWNSQKTAVDALTIEATDWKGVREAIVLLRQRIKGHLLPSLNHVATQLLNLMSNGWLTSVEINEDFDILVDGKKINLLSGAGKALTNLALRIGLGQVLTNSVFGVLIVDEADAGVDQEKAPLISEALRLLTATIPQIIVISHKSGLTADHKVEL